MAGQLTDAELRQQLVALGEKNIGPITGTTRSLYTKKLNNLLASQKQSGRGRTKAQTSRKLIGLSSDESEPEDDNSAPVSRGRTKVTPTRSSRRSARVEVNSEDSPAPTTRPTARPPLRRRRGNVSDNGELSQTSFSTSRDPVRLSVGRGSRYSDQTGVNGDDVDGFQSSDTDGEGADSPDQSGERHYMVNRSINTSAHLDDSAYFGNHSSSRYSSLRDDDQDATAVKSWTNSAQRIPAKSSSRRSLGGTPTRRSMRRSNNVFGNNVHTTSANHEDTSLFEEDKILKSGFKTKEEPASTCSQYVSKVLLVLTVLFFVILTVLYMRMLPDAPALPPLPVETPASDDNWMLCPDDIKGANCFTRGEAELHRKVVLSLSECLNDVAVSHYCGDRASAKVAFTDLMKLVKTKMDKTISSSQLTSSMKASVQLILHNTHWNIKLFNDEQKETRDPLVVELFESATPSLPLLCRLSRSASQVLLTLGVLIFVAVLALVILKCLQYRWRQQEQEMRHVYELVEQIIDILKSHGDNCKDQPDVEPYLAIPHVRDMLIPLKDSTKVLRCIVVAWDGICFTVYVIRVRISPGILVKLGCSKHLGTQYSETCLEQPHVRAVALDRERLTPLWEKARRFLSANESRVREESQKIAGEEFIVWRWLQMSPNGNKVWQGQAFGENRGGGLNSPPYSLTECLKVRNMFDPDMECDHDWHIRIQDAVLEKCGPNHGVVHVAVDTTSVEGCVYIKCESHKAAGEAYNALHGWWFDGKLITVKYLRLERYHERFPDAVHCHRPMQPSNNQRRSLSQPFHRSVMETS